MSVVPINFANVVHVSDEAPLTAYRNSRFAADDPDVIQSLSSNAELGKPARGVETTHPRIHIGISAFGTAREAAENASDWPRLGEYILKLELGAESRASWLRWGKPGHLTIWCEPLTLRSHVTDTLLVGEVT